MAAPRVTRWLRVIAVLMVGLGTTGCAVEGSAVFGADEVVSVDVTTWFLKSEVEADYEVESACELTRNWVRAAPESLTFDPVGAAAGGTKTATKTAAAKTTATKTATKTASKTTAAAKARTTKAAGTTRSTTRRTGPAE